MKPGFKISPSDYRRLSDEELIRRYVELHEYNAIDYVFERYGHIIFGICLKRCGSAATAKTQMEDIFVNAINEVTSRRVKQFRPWLHSYLGNQGMVRNEQEIDAADDDETPLRGHTGDPASARFHNQVLETALGRLPDNQQKCIRLFYGQNKNHIDVAKATGSPVATVQQLLYSGTSLLRNQFTNGNWQHER